jgi:hypothetical protein
MEIIDPIAQRKLFLNNQNIVEKAESHLKALVRIIVKPGTIGKKVQLPKWQATSSLKLALAFPQVKCLLPHFAFYHFSSVEA